MMGLEIVSSAFVNEGVIPTQFTCDGEDFSPDLAWQGGPEQARSYALIVDDPDAPVGTFTHWVAFNIPAETKGLPSGIAKAKDLPRGGQQGTNDYGRIGYGGPCPPPGKPHHYVFHLYALDIQLDLKAGASKTNLLGKMQGHILADAEIIGKYGR